MKNISIITFINIIFLIAFVAIGSSLFIFIKLDKEKYEITTSQRYKLIADTFLTGLQVGDSESHLKKLYKRYNVKVIGDRKKKLFIIINAREKFYTDSFLGRMRVLQLGRNYYLYLQELGYNVMLEDLKPKNYNGAIAVILFVFSMFILLSLYTSLRRKLNPLKLLHEEIKKFSTGAQDFNIKVTSNDEIGKIAKSFDIAIKNINKLTKSKTLFMRNMMHELKTPIAKSMIIAETLEDSRNKVLLKKAVARMDSIVKELATIEKISTKILVLDKQKVLMSRLVEKSLDILMHNNNANIIQKIKDFSLVVDNPLFEIVLKNLIDNALKFAEDGKALIKCYDNNIEIISKGNKLSKNLSEYLEPFYQYEKRKDGFGLGLYIVNEILKLHKLKLEYRYEMQSNIFFIKL